MREQVLVACWSLPITKDFVADGLLLRWPGRSWVHSYRLRQRTTRLSQRCRPEITQAGSIAMLSGRRWPRRSILCLGAMAASLWQRPSTGRFCRASPYEISAATGLTCTAPIPALARNALNVLIDQARRIPTAQGCLPSRVLAQSPRVRSWQGFPTSKDSGLGVTSAPDSASCRGRTRTVGKTGSDGSPRWVTARSGALEALEAVGVINDRPPDRGSTMLRGQTVIEPAWVHLDKFGSFAGTCAVCPTA